MRYHLSCKWLKRNLPHRFEKDYILWRKIGWLSKSKHGELRTDCSPCLYKTLRKTIGKWLDSLHVNTSKPSHFQPSSLPWNRVDSKLRSCKLGLKENLFPERSLKMIDDSKNHNTTDWAEFTCHCKAQSACQHDGWLSRAAKNLFNLPA